MLAQTIRHSTEQKYNEIQYKLQTSSSLTYTITLITDVLLQHLNHQPDFLWCRFRSLTTCWECRFETELGDAHNSIGSFTKYMQGIMTINVMTLWLATGIYNVHLISGCPVHPHTSQPQPTDSAANFKHAFTFMKARYKYKTRTSTAS